MLSNMLTFQCKGAVVAKRASARLRAFLSGYAYLNKGPGNEGFARAKGTRFARFTRGCGCERTLILALKDAITIIIASQNNFVLPKMQLKCVVIIHCTKKRY